MIYFSEQLKIVLLGGDAVKLLKAIFRWIRKLFINDNQPVIKIRADQLNIIILNIHKD